MTRFPIFVAWRYLFAKKSHNAINIVSGVSAAGVCVATAALVCVLSVMNGFNRVIEDMFSAFDPELVILPSQGKVLRLDSPELLRVQQNTDIAVFSPSVEETAMVSYSDRQVPAIVKGVDDGFSALTQIDSIITEGYYQVFDGERERCVVGRGLAAELSVSAFYTGAVRLYAPKRTERVNLLRPEKSLQTELAYIAGTFAVNQIEYDNHVLLVSLACARRLFSYDEQTASMVALKAADGVRSDQLQSSLRKALGADYQVLNRYEQQADFFRISRIEKWLSALLLVFILVIASFNIVGSLSMLMLDKKEDILVLRNLGATPTQVRRIFLYEGWLISSLGALLGLVIGLTMCLVQEHYGLIKLGNGMDYVLSAYPVAVCMTDVLIITLVVLGIGFVAAWYPTRTLQRQLS